MVLTNFRPSTIYLFAALRRIYHSAVACKVHFVQSVRVIKSIRPDILRGRDFFFDGVCSPTSSFWTLRRLMPTYHLGSNRDVAVPRWSPCAINIF